MVIAIIFSSYDSLQQIIAVADDVSISDELFKTCLLVGTNPTLDQQNLSVRDVFWQAAKRGFCLRRLCSVCKRRGVMNSTRKIVATAGGSHAADGNSSPPRASSRYTVSDAAASFRGSFRRARHELVTRTTFNDDHLLVLLDPLGTFRSEGHVCDSIRQKVGPSSSAPLAAALLPCVCHIS